MFSHEFLLPDICCNLLLTAPKPNLGEVKSLRLFKELLFSSFLIQSFTLPLLFISVEVGLIVFCSEFDSAK